MNGGVIAACKKNETSSWELDLAPCLPHNNSLHKVTTTANEYDMNLVAIGDERKTKENLTLQLFPVDLRNLNASPEEDTHDVSRVPIKLRASQFIEFLPTKN